MHKHTAEYFSTPVGPEKTHEEIFFFNYHSQVFRKKIESYANY